MNLVVGKLASDIVLLDVRGVTLIADYFLICTGSTERQVQALVEEISERLREKDIKPLGVEGEASSGWVLMDYSDVIVHVFTPSIRRRYDLEGFWNSAKRVVRIA